MVGVRWAFVGSITAKVSVRANNLLFIMVMFDRSDIVTMTTKIVIFPERHRTGLNFL